MAIRKTRNQDSIAFPSLRTEAHPQNAYRSGGPVGWLTKTCSAAEFVPVGERDRRSVIGERDVLRARLA
jgi:hypothetical protein